MVLHEILYAAPPFTQGRRSPEPCGRRSPELSSRKKSPLSNQRPPRARSNVNYQKVVQRWGRSLHNSSKWSYASSWDPFGSEDPDIFANMSINKAPTSSPSKGAVQTMSTEKKSITLSQTIGAEKNASVQFHSIGPEKMSYTENGRSKQSVFSNMGIDEIAKSVEKSIEEAEALRSEIRQQLLDAADRRFTLQKSFANEVESASEALEIKMREHELKVSECGRQITELELSKIDIDSSFRERQKNARDNQKQLDWFLMERQKRVEGDDFDDIIGQLVDEQKAWQGLRNELAASSRDTDVILTDLYKTKDKAQAHHQVLGQQLLLNRELFREKPQTRNRPEISVAWE